jgi:NAD(P)-dependent dehydrogenase (short-subunit alcohol dehydrogenase family)
MDLTGSSAIVTGGASGIGEGAVRALVDRGAHPVIVDLNEERGSALASELGIDYAHADVADEEQVLAAIAKATARGPLRVLVNAAGIGSGKRVIARDGSPMPQGDFEKVVRVNLLGSFNCLRLCAAEMAKTEPVTADGARAAIVNLTSIAAFDGQIGQAAYSASKGGIVGMTLPIGRDLATFGIRVNTVAPGLIDTPIYGSGEEAEAMKARLGQDVVFPKRLGTADELVDVIMLCVTNDYVNCEVIRVDGGIRMPPRSG